MSEVIGKIEWLPDAPKEYPAGSGDFNIGMKVKGAFYNLYDDKEKLEETLKTLKKGFEVKLEVAGQKIEKMDIVNATADESSQGGMDDLTTFEELLDDAHEKGLLAIHTEMVSVDWEKKSAVFKARVNMALKKPMKISKDTTIMNQVFEAYGDATQENCGNLVQKHFVRMAETRAIARALRWATNNAKAAEEETEHGELPDEKKSEEKPVENETEKADAKTKK